MAGRIARQITTSSVDAPWDGSTAPRWVVLGMRSVMSDVPSDATDVPDGPEPREQRRALVWRWARRLWFLPVLVFALVELGLHLWQTRDVIQDADWEAVRAKAEAQTEPEDLVVVWPRWVNPLGRMHLGDALMTTERVARADESRFPRATEVSFGSARHPSLDAWSVESEERIGPFVLRRLQNPSPRPVIDDLVARARPPSLQVTKVDRGKKRPCSFRKGAPVTGPLGFGPAAPAERYHCARGAWVGQSVIADLDYAPRRCIYAPPPGGSAVLQLRFASVRFGSRLEGHHALYVEAERDGKGPPVRIAFSSEGRSLGEAVHEDGQGWGGFGFDTPDLEGTTGEIVAEVTSPNARRRMYCFEATTR